MVLLFLFLVTIITEAADTMPSQSETAVISASQSDLGTQEEAESGLEQFDDGSVNVDLEG